jgi:hypothetical protein
MTFQSGVAAVGGAPYLTLTWLVATVLSACIALFLGMLALEVWRSVRFARRVLAVRKGHAGTSAGAGRVSRVGRRHTASQASGALCEQADAAGAAAGWDTPGPAESLAPPPSPTTTGSLPPPGATGTAASSGDNVGEALENAYQWVVNPMRVSTALAWRPALGGVSAPTPPADAADVSLPEGRDIGGFRNPSRPLALPGIGPDRLRSPSSRPRRGAPTTTIRRPPGSRDRPRLPNPSQVDADDDDAPLAATTGGPSASVASSLPGGGSDASTGRAESGYHSSPWLPGTGKSSLHVPVSP